MIGFEISEEIGVKCIDPRPYVIIKTPDDWTDERVEAFLEDLGIEDSKMDNDELADMLAKVVEQLRKDDNPYGLLAECRICQLYTVIVDKDEDGLN